MSHTLGGIIIIVINIQIDIVFVNCRPFLDPLNLISFWSLWHSFGFDFGYPFAVFPWSYAADHHLIYVHALLFFRWQWFFFVRDIDLVRVYTHLCYLDLFFLFSFFNSHFCIFWCLLLLFLLLFKLFGIFKNWVCFLYYRFCFYSRRCRGALLDNVFAIITCSQILELFLQSSELIIEQTFPVLMVQVYCAWPV